MLLSGLFVAALVSGFLSSYRGAPAHLRLEGDGPQESAAQTDAATAGLTSEPSAERLTLPTALPKDQQELQAEALTVMGRLVASYPDDAETYAGMARLQAYVGNPAEEERYWRLCLERDPQHAQARQGLESLLAAGQGDSLSTSRQPADDLAALSARIADLHTYAGQLYLKHGEASPAEALWQRAKLLSPQNTNCRQALAYYYLQQQQPLETIRVLSELTDLEPANPAYPLEIARLNLGLKRFDAAEQTLIELCDKMPGEPAGFAALAQLYLSTRQKLGESAVLAQTAVKLAPSAANQLTLAAACEMNGDLPGAIAALEAALRLEPDNQQYQQMLTKLRERLQSGPPR